jgi:nucleotide-binding universal stress UspA family protein
MAIKDILLVLEAEAPVTAREYALSFASKMGAHLSVAAVPAQILMPISAAGDYPYELIATIAEDARVAAQQTYKEISAAAPAGVQTELVNLEGIPGLAQSEIGSLARHFDLAITTQSGPDSGDRAVINATLFDTGRPVIVVPYIHKGPAKLGHVLVAWDGSSVAARALNDALPLLKVAGRVEIVTVTPVGTPNDELPGFNISRHLARHGINAELRMLPKTEDVASTLLSYAADAGADLLVMGAYGHSRLREFVFGGTSADILKSMTLPVFMVH